jgi:hypothetical protein
MANTDPIFNEDMELPRSMTLNAPSQPRTRSLVITSEHGGGNDQIRSSIFGVEELSPMSLTHAGCEKAFQTCSFVVILRTSQILCSRRRVSYFPATLSIEASFNRNSMLASQESNMSVGQRISDQLKNRSVTTADGLAYRLLFKSIIYDACLRDDKRDLLV